MFKHLDSQQTDKIKDAMFLVEHETDDVVIKEGVRGHLLKGRCHLKVCKHHLYTSLDAIGKVDRHPMCVSLSRLDTKLSKRLMFPTQVTVDNLQWL